MTGTVYHLFCTATGEAYIGQTRKPLAVRWCEHVSTAKGTPWKRSPLLEAIRRHGPGAFVVTPLVVCSPRDLDRAERDLVEAFARQGPLLNVQAGGRRSYRLHAEGLSVGRPRGARRVHIDSTGPSTAKSTTGNGGFRE